MRNHARRLAIVLALVLATMAAPEASAFTMNASALIGGSLLNGNATTGTDQTSTLLGGELTVDLGTYVELGAFLDYNFISYEDDSGGSFQFYGGLLRVGLLGHGSNLFADTRLGISRRTGGPFSSDYGAALGAGLGYRFWILPYMSLSPRLGFRVLSEPYQGASDSSTAVDGTLLLTFGF